MQTELLAGQEWSCSCVVNYLGQSHNRGLHSYAPHNRCVWLFIVSHYLLHNCYFFGLMIVIKVTRRKSIIRHFLHFDMKLTDFFFFWQKRTDKRKANRKWWITRLYILGSWFRVTGANLAFAMELVAPEEREKGEVEGLAVTSSVVEDWLKDLHNLCSCQLLAQNGTAKSGC